MALAEASAPKPTLRELGVNLKLYEEHYTINRKLVEGGDPFDKNYEVFELLHDPRVPRHARDWFCRMGLDCSDVPSHVIVATADHRLVGFFAFDVLFRKTHIEACGTWVSPSYQRYGIATAMWKKALRHFPRAGIAVTPGTKAGKSFIRALERMGLPVDGY